MTEDQFKREFERIRRWEKKLRPQVLELRDSIKKEKRSVSMHEGKLWRLWRKLYWQWIELTLAKDEEGEYLLLRFPQINILT